jgi:ribosomal protein L11 methyltransferase
MPDGVSPGTVAEALGVARVRVSPAAGHDDGSVWRLSRPELRLRTLVIAADGAPAPPGAITLLDSAAFGTGLHPTTRLCLEAIEILFDADVPERVLDVGTGSGVLAIAALRLGARCAVGLDTDGDALRVAARNARANGVGERLTPVHGGPEAIAGQWPLVLANIRAAELMAMSAALSRRLASGARLVLSGIPDSLDNDVAGAYQRLGLREVGRQGRDGWSMLVFAPTW